MLIRFNAYQVENVIQHSPNGKNTKFLNASHSLWTRFKNYEKQKPFALIVDGAPVALVFATISARSGYMNLYEIVTVQGEEGKGYGSQIWDKVIQSAVEDYNVDRLKMSCTPSSVTWHNRNGMIFWAVDPSGSLRTDQPLFATRELQLEFRERCMEEPTLAMPLDQKVTKQFLREGLENHKFGTKKTLKVEKAIIDVGDSWMRPAFLEEEGDHGSLEDYL